MTQISRMFAKQCKIGQQRGSVATVASTIGGPLPTSRASVWTRTRGREHFMSTFNQLRHLSRAGANVLHIASYEWERVRGQTIGLAKELGLPLKVWSQSTGLLSCDEAGVVTPSNADLTNVDLIDPVEVLRKVHSSAEPGVWLLEDFQPFLRAEHHALLRWVREIARLPGKPRKLIVLSTPMAGLPVDLRKEVPTVELELPGIEDLLVVLKDAAMALGVRASEDKSLLDAARGLTVMEARLAFGQAAAELGRLDHSAVPLVAREKERIIKQSEVLNATRPTLA